MSRHERPDNYVPPGQARSLRACMICSFVATQSRFISEGCPNCDQYLGTYAYLQEPENVKECTSQIFEGLCHIADPKQSWVARWQRLDKFEPGMYAVKVVGNLPDEVIGVLAENGFKYIPRDGTELEETEA